MPNSVAKFGFGWMELPSVGKKRKSVEKEELNLLQHIQHRQISFHVDGHDLSLNPLDRCCDWLSPVHLSHLSQLDASASSEYEKCLDLKTGRLYMVKRSTTTTRSRQGKSIPSSFGETEGEQGVSLDLGLHLGSNTSLQNSNNNGKKSCNASPTHSTISFQEEENEGAPLSSKKGNNNSNSKSSLLGSRSSCSSNSNSGLVTVGCPKCLIFLMVSQEDPFCPRCGTSSLLDLSLC